MAEYENSISKILEMQIQMPSTLVSHAVNVAVQLGNFESQAIGLSRSPVDNASKGLRGHITVFQRKLAFVSGL